MYHLVVNGSRRVRARVLISDGPSDGFRSARFAGLQAESHYNLDHPTSPLILGSLHHHDTTTDCQPHWRSAAPVALDPGSRRVIDMATTRTVSGVCVFPSEESRASDGLEPSSDGRRVAAGDESAYSLTRRGYLC